MAVITIFSWGYWGWGNATRELVQGIDAVEQSCRVSRDVHADGVAQGNVELEGGVFRVVDEKAVLPVTGCEA